ncbi:MAG: IS1595 family transposase [Chloroflexi bacterium]|nr:IS1595 family transposase [Chloroflexota bacterium]
MARRKGPGKHYRKGMSIIDLTDRFPNDETAEAWFVESRWPNGIRCAHCESENVAENGNHPTMPYHCRACRKFFSVKTNTVMHSSKVGYRKWALAIYILTTNIKGTSSMKLHRDVGVSQKTAWHMAHRIRKAWQTDAPVFAGPVESDETFVGGLESNKHADKKLNAGRGPVGKAAVVGVKDRATNKVSAAPVEATDARTLQGFVLDRTEAAATVYTDEARAYDGLPRLRQAVKHSIGEYVDGQAHTQGIESFWAMLKRGYQGTYHKLSEKHLARYIAEFEGRHNQRPLDTIEQMSAIARGMDGKRLRYEDLIGPAETRQPRMI